MTIMRCYFQVHDCCSEEFLPVLVLKYFLTKILSGHDSGFNFFSLSLAFNIWYKSLAFNNDIKHILYALYHSHFVVRCSTYLSSTPILVQCCFILSSFKLVSQPHSKMFIMRWTPFRLPDTLLTLISLFPLLANILRLCLLEDPQTMAGYICCYANSYVNDRLLYVVK